MALFGFGMYGIAALAGDNDTFARLNFSVATAALGFLYFNFSPTRIFMGDAGSIQLGFLIAGMGCGVGNSVFGLSGFRCWCFLRLL